MVGQRLQEVARDFYLVAGMVAPPHTGMVAEDADRFEGRVLVNGPESGVSEATSGQNLGQTVLAGR